MLAPATLTPVRFALRAIELLAVFFLAPALLAWLIRSGVLNARQVIFPAIWGLGLFALIALLRDPAFQRRQFWNFAGVRPALPGILARFALAAVALTALLAWLRPDLMLRLPRERPDIWLMVMLGYPVVSVYAQELAFRTFFFHRYAPLLARAVPLIAINALAFGWAHVIMLNFYAVAFSIVGGALFARTYLSSRSTAAVCLEHALYGCFIFTIGWGWFFFGGAVGSR